jgi:hypothetical protein
MVTAPEMPAGTCECRYRVYTPNSGARNVFGKTHVQSCHLPMIPHLLRWMGHQSKTKASSENRAHNEPMNLSPDITKEGHSPLLSTNVLGRRSSEE